MAARRNARAIEPVRRARENQLVRPIKLPRLVYANDSKRWTEYRVTAIERPQRLRSSRR